jgi:hypothetical protein
MNKFTLGVFCLSLSLGWSPLVWADAVTDWNANAEKATIAACLDPLNTTRMYAMVHIAIHDALNTIDRRFRLRGLAGLAGGHALRARQELPVPAGTSL